METKKFTIDNKYIDANGHLSEVGYYYYAVQTVWEINKDRGIMPIYEKFNIGPIIFSTNIEFKKEIFLNDIIKVKIRFSDIKDSGRKWTRINEVSKEDGSLSAKIISSGAFFNRKTRKVITPPKEIYHKLFI
tara:strand:+ start:367 stop:762 length:396 start_codon:yes stop_codon:yes gene_type:complete